VLPAGETGKASTTVLGYLRVIVLCFCCLLMLFLSCTSHYVPPVIFIVVLFLFMSYVCKVTRLRAGRLGVRNWAGVRDVTLLEIGDTGPALGPFPFPLTTGTGVISRQQSDRGMMLTADLHKAEIKNDWSCTSPSPYVFMTWMGTALPFVTCHLVVFVFLTFMLFSFPLFLIRSL
jgi:hypothetical protein